MKHTLFQLVQKYRTTSRTTKGIAIKHQFQIVTKRKKHDLKKKKIRGGKSHFLNAQRENRARLDLNENTLVWSR